jgi:hypothetical protein
MISLYQKLHALYRCPGVRLITTLHYLDGLLVIVLTSASNTVNNSLSDQKSTWDALASKLVTDLIIAFRQEVDWHSACQRNEKGWVEPTESQAIYG